MLSSEPVKGFGDYVHILHKLSASLSEHLEGLGESCGGGLSPAGDCSAPVGTDSSAALALAAQLRK